LQYSNTQRRTIDPYKYNAEDFNRAEYFLPFQINIITMLEDIFTISKNDPKKSEQSYKAASLILFCSLLCSCAILGLLTGRAMEEKTENIQKHTRDTFKAGVVEYAVVAPDRCSKVSHSCIFHPHVQYSRNCVPMRRLWMG
jgi:hypothetical protein